MGVVWILGAGFSKSLGGPLLPTLLSGQSWIYLRARYSQVAERLLDRRGAQLVQKLLRLSGWEVREPGRRAFVDAEDVLENLDEAAADGGHAQRRRLSSLVEEEEITAELAWEMSAAAKHLVAAQCAAFLRDFPIGGERWEPYVHWAAGLRSDDTIVTFNYDLVVETAASAAKRQLDIVLGEEPEHSLCPRLLKLHGSVDWRAHPGGGAIGVEKPDFAVACADEDLAIATPGRSKKDAARRWEELWRLATEAIIGAESVVFVGYRFPPSDAQARRRLLGAIASLRLDDVAVHTVLGPDIRDPHTMRLQALLRHSLLHGSRQEVTRTRPRPQRESHRAFSLDVHPLFAEDFLGVVGRQDVLDAHRFDSK